MDCHELELMGDILSIGVQIDGVARMYAYLNYQRATKDVKVSNRRFPVIDDVIGVYKVVLKGYCIEIDPRLPVSKLLGFSEDFIQFTACWFNIGAPSEDLVLLRKIEENRLTEYEIRLHRVHSLRRDEGSLSLNELTVLYTSLSKKVANLESELKQTKETYSTALTKLILRVKKLEKLGSIIEEIDADTDIILVTPIKVSNQSDQSKDHLRVLSVAKVLEEAAKQGRGSGVSTASDSNNTAGGNAKDKGKEIMQEHEPPKKLKKRVQVQMSMDEEIAKKMFEEEQAKVITEQEQERMNLEAALELQRKLDAREEVLAEATQATQEHEIDWNDPSILRYHAQLNRPYSVAEVRKNMIMYLKNQRGYKMSYFNGMKYEDIPPIFEQVWDQTQSFMPMDSEKESKEKAKERMKRKTSKAREDKIKRQKTKDDPEKLTLMEYVQVMSDSEEAINVIPLAVKSLIVSWKSYCKGDIGFYEIHRANGNYKTYKFFSEMLNDFDKDDLIVLYRLFNEKYASTRPGFDDLMLWGDMKIMFDPDENVSLDLSRLATTLNRLERSIQTRIYRFGCSSVKDKILAAQGEASTVENTIVEMLRGLDQQMEKKQDGYLVHPGADKMYYNLGDMHWWPCMKKDIATYVSDCLTCSKVKAETSKTFGFVSIA
ncbi:ribonuclease H-like domain-containing protein [Tanacetum coccineum]